MPDIAIIGEKTFLFEKLLDESGREHTFVKPEVLGSPFLPQFRMAMIPTGFANPQYSKTLAALKASKSKIAEFLERGGILTIFGPLVPEHDYEWLPLPSSTSASTKVQISLRSQNTAAQLSSTRRRQNATATFPLERGLRPFSQTPKEGRSS